MTHELFEHFEHPELNYVFEDIPDELVEEIKYDLKTKGLGITARTRGYQAENYDNFRVAGRLVIFDLRRKVPQTWLDYVDVMKDKFRNKYVKFMRRHADVIQREINAHTDVVYRNNDYFSISAYKAIYLAKRKFAAEPSETIEYMCMRVAVQLRYHRGIDAVLQAFRSQVRGHYTLASPTLFNSCMKRNTLSSCYIGQVADSLETILDSVKVFGLITQACGALGNDLSLLRCSEIDGGNKAVGLSPWCRMYDATAVGCKQAEKRLGSVMDSLRTHHIDIESFIQIVQKVGDQDNNAKNIFISVFASGIFFERARKKQNWTLMDPHNTPWLNGIYGQEFERRYVQTEILIKEREKEYIKWKTMLDKCPETDYESYREIQSHYLKAVENRILHKVINAYDLFLAIVDVQRKCGQPFINNADAVNFKCNLKNVGTVNAMNLCQEMTLPSGLALKDRVSIDVPPLSPLTDSSLPETTSIVEEEPDEKEEEDEDTPNFDDLEEPEDIISSCNLGSICLYKFANGPLSTYQDITDAYDFVGLGQSAQELVHNINGAIDNGRCPLDKYDRNGNLLVAGRIRKPNEDNRPLGIGYQGFAEALYTLDLRIEEDKSVEIWNIMAFACVYFNAMCASIDLAIRDGPYKNFQGSPLSQGDFQFDLWRKEFEMLGPNKIRTHEPDAVLPTCWNQQVYNLSNGDVIEPSWESLRQAVMKHGCRNSMLITVMPTASSSQILRSSECIEMPTTNLYTRALITGHYPVLNRFMTKDLEQIGVWNNVTYDYIRVTEGSIKDLDVFIEMHKTRFYPNFHMTNMPRLKYIIQKYKTMWEIKQRYMIKLMADRSRYICHAASMNIYLRNPTNKNIMSSHLTAYDSGLKTLCYYLKMAPDSKPVKLDIDPEFEVLVLQVYNKGIKLDTGDVVCRPGCTSCSS